MSSRETVGHQPPEVEPSVLKRAIGASAIGNATEWYDYGVYSYTTTFIGFSIFGSADAYTLVLLGYAVSFIARPLGGLIWGPLGDRIGRKRVLALTILLMSAATTCIGLIPSHASIGVLAPVLLFGLRLIQGFSTGGEYGGAATFMAEYSPDRKRGICGSFLEFGTLVGFSLGALIALVFDLALSTEAMNSWGWRVPFFLALPMGLVGLYLRSRMEDTPVFRETQKLGDAEQSATTAFGDLVKGYLPQLLRLGGLVIALNVANYTLISYMPTYLAGTIGLSTTQSLVVPIIGMLGMMVLVPFAGAVSDRTGRKRHWWASLVGLFVFAIPMYWLMGQSALLAVVGFTVLGVLYVPQLATISATFPAMFPTPVRYAGLAISYNISTALFGGTAPLVNEWAVDKTGDSLFPAYYMMAACVIGMLALIKVPETAGHSVRGTEIPGTDEHRTEMAGMGVAAPH